MLVPSMRVHPRLTSRTFLWSCSCWMVSSWIVQCWFLSPGLYGLNFTTASSATKAKGKPWEWRHNERDGVSNYQRLGCLHNRLFRRISKKTSKLRVTGLCEGNSPVTGEFPAQRASNADFCFHLMTSSCKGIYDEITPNRPPLKVISQWVGHCGAVK